MADSGDLKGYIGDVYTAIEEAESALAHVRDELDYVRTWSEEFEGGADAPEVFRALAVELTDDFDPERIAEFDEDLAALVRNARRIVREHGRGESS